MADIDSTADGLIEFDEILVYDSSPYKSAINADTRSTKTINLQGG